MAENVIIKGRDNRVDIPFSFSGPFAASGLNTFTEVTLEIGGDSYSTTDNPTQLIIVDDNTLSLRIGDSTELADGLYLPEIVGFSATYDDGYLISGQCKPIIGTIRVC